ncbi:Mut7-C RNAse domain-containing protein [Pantanalinema sp. GBBB05]|uniref:Mut7-C RNAse domain-containing protein n=1 Tax=Pantanalinema sp. GBBB05 TaxID=2604139 RepID=UPI001D28237B|nr:twitching motility protein PilT [Pantanalinema sp. GBBB05]
MNQAYFRFYGTLKDFLSPDRRQTTILYAFKTAGSIKDAIEALGVPHPEVDLILVNGESVDFDYLIQANDRVSVYPAFTTLDVSSVTRVRPRFPRPFRFVADVHLGKLATSLRLLGFDTWYHNQADDQQLAEISSRDDRILLTQDRGLLKRRVVTYGYLVRHHEVYSQVVEVLQRFELFEAIAPMTRCLRCSGELKLVDKVTIHEQLEPLTQQYYDEFFQCQTCGQIYWKGTHYQRLQQFVDRVRQAAKASVLV